jgi:hypothetical protein
MASLRRGLKGRGSYWRGSNRREFPFPGGRGETVERMMLTGGSGLSAGRERGDGTVSGVHVAGLRGYSSAGPNRSPRPFILFF